MHYSWDKEKNRRNVAVHGIAFSDAARIFESQLWRESNLCHRSGERNGDSRLFMPTQRMTKGASSQPGVRSRTKDATTGKTSNGKTTKRNSSTSRRREVKTDWQRLDSMTPAAIRKAILADPDAHPTDEAFWKTAKVVFPTP
jgi:hypothetical protein